ncbi:MAG TPA: carbon monoxide dehydrogenase [Syntrophaceae bacterium]|nr:carbon monoxide dehydrogenase [Syntrophaceae bacterium]
MSMVIALAGKGGTGKTTLAALIIRYLKNRGDGAILAVDADPSSNLAQPLGLTPSVTIGSMKETFLKGRDLLPAGIPKETYLELKLHELLVESERVDLLTMGRPEGRGCYCYVNNILRKYLDLLTENYAYVVIDNEAGMEHLSRSIVRDVDILLITTDPSMSGIRSAKKVKDLVIDLELSVKKQYIIVDRVIWGLSHHLLAEAERLGLILWETIPEDAMISEYDLIERPLIQLPEDSSAVRAVNRIMECLLV